MKPEKVEESFTATMRDPYRPAAFKDNRIHTDSGARELGFDGAFVSGIKLYRWSVPTILDALGEEWLDQGWITLRFRRPTYPDTRIRVSLTPDVNSSFSFQALDDDDELKIAGSVGLGFAPWLADVHATGFRPPDPDIDERPLLTLEEAPVGGDLRSYQYGKGTKTRIADEESGVELETNAGTVIHPVTVARQMVAFLAHSYDYGHPAAIHVSMHVQNFARIPADAEVVLCGTMSAAYERNGHHYCVTDADLYSAAGRRLARQRNTGIFKVRGTGNVDG